MNYEIQDPDSKKLELWKEETIFVVTGGFNVDKTILPSTMTYLPKGSLLNINHTTRVAKLVKTAKVYNAAISSATDIDIDKAHALKVGDVVARDADGTAYAISAIDTTSSADYDTITIGTTLGYALSEGDVLFVAAAEGASGAAELVQANAVNYVDVDLAGTPAATVIVRAYEVKEAKLPYATHALNKTSLTSRFYFI